MSSPGIINVVNHPPLPEAEVTQIARNVEKYPAADSLFSDPEEKGHHLTDIGNARRMAEQYGNDIRYCHDWGSWLFWQGKRWQIDNVGAVHQMAKKAILSIYNEVGPSASKDQRKAMAQHALRSEHRTRLDAMVYLCRSEPGIPILPEELDCDDWLMTCTNGVIDLRTGHLREHCPEDLMTKLAPVEFDLEAQCPQWEEFLNQVMDGNADLIRFLQRAIGYSLTGSTREQVFFILFGSGANGKSTFLETIQAMVGDYGQQAEFSTFLVRQSEAPRNDIAALRGARLVTASESTRGRMLDEAIVKQLTGGDTVRARLLYQNHFEFQPRFKIYLATNDRPTIKGTDFAIWRRLRLIPFNVKIPEKKQDKDLPQKLLAELPGILAWATQGCLDWLEKGLGEPDEVMAATTGYREEQDIVGRFLSECCLMEPGAHTGASVLYAAFLSWTRESGEPELSQRNFGAYMTRRAFERRRSTAGKVVYEGVGLVVEESKDWDDITEEDLK